MARTKSAAVAESHEITPEQTPGVEIAAAAANQMAALRHEYGQGRDLINQLLGQAQAFNAAGDLLRTFGVSKLAFVKENKLYQQLAGMKTPNGSELRGTWVEFCELLGMSDDKANQDIANLRAFGEEALENMNRVGIGYRELRQYRKLPADERLALIEAAKDGDKEGLLDLAEILISRHTSEKEALTKQVEEVTAENAAKDQVLADKNKKLDELDKKLRRKEVDLPKWDERVGDLNGECSMIALGVEELLEKYWVILQALTNAKFENDIEDRARAMLAKNFADRTQRIVDRVAFIQAKMFEEFDGYINEPTYLMAGSEG